MIRPDDADRVVATYRDLLAGGARAIVTNRIRHAAGHWIWVEAHMRVLRDAKTGAALGILGSLRDVSRRKEIEDQLESANRRLRSLASQDGLTGLANRRGFDEVFEEEWRRAARDDTPLGLIMLEVDRFKGLNDTYGHQAGDDCLCALARAIEGALQRPGDFVARYGGEEFVVVLPNTDDAGTAEIGERIRRAMEALDIEHCGNVGGVVTISAGAVSQTGGAFSQNPRDLLAAADRNLYATKAAGRNRVVQEPSSRLATAF